MRSLLNLVRVNIMYFSENCELPIRVKSTPEHATSRLCGQLRRLQ